MSRDTQKEISGRETAMMYDPLALDRQRIEQERLRRSAECATPRNPKRRRRH